MDYKEFLNERKAGMMATVESMESPCLEAFKRRQREEGEKAKRSFLSFLRKRKPEVAEECEKKPNKIMEIAKRKTEEYKAWAEEHPKLASLLLALAITGGYNANMHMQQQHHHQVAMHGHTMAVNAHHTAMGIGPIM